MAKTYNDIYMDARKRFKQAGISGYSQEARILLAHVAGKKPEEFYRDIRLYTSAQYEEEAELMIERRLKGEPLAYLTGSWEFYGLPLVITKDVLIPRTDTEIVAETAIKLIRGGTARVLDLCCGSGCLGLAIAANAQSVKIVLVDNSNAALRVSRINAALNRLSSRTSCINGDALGDPGVFLGTFDMIVSNPPYIKTSDIAGLDSSVREYEPVGALDGGEDGLDFYRSICKKWARLLNRGGFLVFECGIGQSGDVRAIGEANGLDYIEIVKDTLDIDRVVVFQKTR